MKTILVTAYAINPYKGSEDGMGWHFVNQIAKDFRVTVITRNNNLPAIQQYITENPTQQQVNMEFVGYDLPKHLMFWKKGSFGSLPYFYLWQRTMPAFIKRQGFEFDLVHNVNFHNDWTPSFLWKLDKPFVWGPIGHHPQIPVEYLGRFGAKALWKDRFTWAVKQAFWRLSPSLKKCTRRADLILAMNKSVEKVLPSHERTNHIMPSVGTPWVEPVATARKANFEIISVGRFVPLKGFDITIEAFALFYHQLPTATQAKTKLRLIGKGPLLPKMKAMVKELDIQEVVSFVEWLPKEQLTQYYQQASVFLFPSHEGAGMVVAEAMSYGLPVICFDNCGPGEFVTPDSGIRIPYATFEESVTGFGNALLGLMADPVKREKLAQGARKRFENYFDWEAKGKELRKLYTQILKSA